MSANQSITPLDLRQSGIYLITNLINGKKYVGQSQNIKVRWGAHLRCGKNPTTAIARAISKYGITNFKFEVIEFAPLDQLDELESFHIRLANSIAPHGYNIAPYGGATRGLKASAESRAKMSIARKGRKTTIETRLKISKSRQSLSDETRAKLREASTGRKLSQETKDKIAASRQNLSAETKAKISQAGKGRVPSQATKNKLSAAMKGRSFSEETRAKLSLASKNMAKESRLKIAAFHKGRKRSPETCARIKASRWGHRQGEIQLSLLDQSKEEAV